MAPITNSLVFRLFDDKALRMRAITVMIVVGMSGFILGPLLGGTALAHVRWEWLLVVNAPIALIACIGVRLGVAADRREDLTDDALDLPGAALSVATIGLACFSLTSGVEHGWLSVPTVASVLGAVAAAVAFVWHERRSASPMLDLGLFSNGTVRGAAIAQTGTSIAMASVMFGLVLHFQYAYGWSPVKAGLANLPIIITMLAATPLSEGLAKRYGHRIACFIGAVFLAVGLAGLAWGVEHGYLAIAVSMVLMTIGLRTVMTICAVALVDAMPANRTSIGAALNDTAQEVGTSVGTAVVGTMIAVLVTTQLPIGTWVVRLARHGGTRWRPEGAMSLAVATSLFSTSDQPQRGEHDDRHLHLRRLLQPRRLRRRQRQLDRLLGQAGPGVARPPPRPVRPGAADGLRGQDASAVRRDAGLEHRGLRSA